MSQFHKAETCWNENSWSIGIMSNFCRRFFYVLGVKNQFTFLLKNHCSIRTEKLNKMKLKFSYFLSSKSNFSILIWNYHHKIFITDHFPVCSLHKDWNWIINDYFKSNSNLASLQSPNLKKLQVEIGSLHVEIADLKNLTRRLSDHYLDLELLDQQARDVLGYVRTDELVIQ